MSNNQISLVPIFKEQGEYKPFIKGINIQSDSETITFQLPPYFKALVEATSP